MPRDTLGVYSYYNKDGTRPLDRKVNRIGELPNMTTFTKPAPVCQLSPSEVRDAKSLHNPHARCTG